jgi:acyl-homoserine-lactone acylase
MILGALLCAGQVKAAAGPATEILWDTYGVPHIFAKDNAGLFRAFGYAQMESHGDLILRLYGQARGRAAEYWGDRYTASDRWVWTNGIPDRAVAWYKQQTPEFSGYLDAFVAGINEYARDHGDRLSPEVRAVLPVTASDVLAHTERVILYTFVAGEAAVRGQVRLSQTRSSASTPPSAEGLEETDLGSNAWAISPKRTTAGHALLLANPHLPWEDLYLFYESQWTAPGVHIYGATLVGMPSIAIGFNDDLGWTHTVNTISAMSVYELAALGDGYLFEGKEKAFVVSHHTLKIKQDNGSLKEEDLTVRTSVQGPVVMESNGRMFALRVAGLDAPGANEEWWNMGRAHNLKEFETALAPLQIPMFNVVYADRAGHISYVFNGRVPVRSKGDWAFWQRVVAGDSEATLWSKVHAYSELPQVTDPVTGWLQNTNDPPWTCTVPAAFDADKYPPYISPRAIGFRPQRSIRMIRDEAAFTLDKLVADKYSTRSEMADRILDELVSTALGSDSEKAKAAALVLSKWDRSYDAGSKGGVLFGSFAQRWLSGPRSFFVPWSAADPLLTPKQIADPVRALSVLVDAAEATQSRFGAMDVAWGEANHFTLDKVDLPGNGGLSGLGVFRVIEYTPPMNGPGHAAGGDSFVAAVEFSNPVQARVVLNYGNASQTGSPHRSDQLSLAAAKQMRVAWLTRGEVEKHLESKESVP